MDALIGVPAWFVNEPVRGMAMAFLFLAFAVAERRLAHRVEGIKSWVQLVPATGWMLFALNEQETRTSGANIRIDLLFTFPVLAIVSLICLGAFVMNVRRALR